MTFSLYNYLFVSLSHILHGFYYTKQLFIYFLKTYLFFLVSTSILFIKPNNYYFIFLNHDKILGGNLGKIVLPFFTWKIMMSVISYGNKKVCRINFLYFFARKRLLLVLTDSTTDST